MKACRVLVQILGHTMAKEIKLVKTCYVIKNFFYAALINSFEIVQYYKGYPVTIYICPHQSQT